MNSICDLIDTYAECIEIQNKVISVNRARLNVAEKKRDYEEMRRLRKVLNILYDERNELEELNNCLKEYGS